MKNKILTFLILLFLTVSCGYQPLYKQDTINKSFTIKEIEFIGDKKLGAQISSRLPLLLKKNDETLNKFIIETNKKTIEITKNSKGQITSYRTEINVMLKIVNKENLIRSKNFKRNFSYNDDENKFKLKEYQNNIEENLINGIIEDIITYLNY